MNETASEWKRKKVPRDEEKKSQIKNAELFFPAPRDVLFFQMILNEKRMIFLRVFSWGG